MSLINRRHLLWGGVATGVLASCSKTVQSVESSEAVVESFGTIEVFEPELADLIDSNAPIDVLAEGFSWSEGPTWDKSRNCLYFTDVPENTAYKWSEAEGNTIFLKPSGIADADPELFREPGANGLLWVGPDEMLICNHGQRWVERYTFSTGTRTSLLPNFDGKKFNSPNDLILADDGTLYFTDPPYGLKGLNDSPAKEMAVNGVYQLSPNGEAKLVVDDMTFPNGVVLAPDGQYLYVAQSDPTDPYIRRLKIDGNGTVLEDVRWFDAAALLAAGGPGLPDGMAVTETGHIFATGPGGVLILNPEGVLIGRLNLGQATANCAFGEDGQSLFITSKDKLLRVRTKALGLGWST